MPTTTQIPNRPNDETILGLEPRTTDSSSGQIRTWPQRIKDQALFSARTTSDNYLAVLREKLTAIASRTVTPQQAERSLRDSLQSLGYSPEHGFPDNRGNVPPARPGSIRDLSSSNRIRLIIDTNVKQARSLGQLAASETPAMLMTSPAWKLTRTGARKKPRGDWINRWREAGNACGWHGASKRQMIALKTSPIWQKLGDGAGGYRDTLGTPYPPFAFGSGMAWVNYDWEDWEELCAKEGIPNCLDDIEAKASELKRGNRRESARTEAPAQETERGTGTLEEARRGRISPLVSETRPTAMTQPRTDPVRSIYRADFSARDAADDTVDNALDELRRDVKTVTDYIKDINAMRDEINSKAVWYPSKAKALAETNEKIDAYRTRVAEIETRLTELQGRVVNYGASIGATPVPTDRNGQTNFDMHMNRIESAARRTAKAARPLVRTAEMHANAATKTYTACIKELF